MTNLDYLREKINKLLIKDNIIVLSLDINRHKDSTDLRLYWCEEGFIDNIWFEVGHVEAEEIKEQLKSIIRIRDFDCVNNVWME